MESDLDRQMPNFSGQSCVPLFHATQIPPHTDPTPELNSQNSIPEAGDAMGDLQPLFGVPTGTDCIENDGKTVMPDQPASTEQGCSQLTVTTGGIDSRVMHQASSCVEDAQTSDANITPSHLYSIPNAAAVPCLNAVPPVLAPAMVIQEGLGHVIPNPLGNPSGPGLNGFGMQGVQVSPQGATPNPLPQPAISVPF